MSVNCLLKVYKFNFFTLTSYYYVLSNLYFKSSKKSEHTGNNYFPKGSKFFEIIYDAYYKGSIKKKRMTAQLLASKSGQTAELATNVCVSWQPAYSNNFFKCVGLLLTSTTIPDLCISNRRRHQCVTLPYYIYFNKMRALQDASKEPVGSGNSRDTLFSLLRQSTYNFQFIQLCYLITAFVNISLKQQACLF